MKNGILDIFMKMNEKVIDLLDDLCTLQNIYANFNHYQNYDFGSRLLLALLSI